MKAPIPLPPADAPPGTIALSSQIGWFSASLHVSGADLLPDNVTNLLGVSPSQSQIRGTPLLRDDGSVRYIPKFGRWSRTIKAAETDEWDISEVLKLLFSDMTTNLEDWAKVAHLGRIHISLGLSLAQTNQEFELDQDLLRFLGERSISVWFDVYAESHET